MDWYAKEAARLAAFVLARTRDEADEADEAADAIEVTLRRLVGETRDAVVVCGRDASLGDVVVRVGAAMQKYAEPA